ncbi:MULTISPECIES: DUF1127 domain-containing protein [Vibrio]|uniref:DUF1127 domain-containing protein n=1 Tax=Vibrio TaxID=662 RepID=UPI003D112749
MNALTMKIRAVSLFCLINLVKKNYSITKGWYQNHRTRKHLSELPMYLWDDIGVTQEQVVTEARKEFKEK